MILFLSWSGVRSRKLAQALHPWLALMLQAVRPWMSEQDVDAGQRWGNEIAVRLQEANFGIICVTPENREAPWLLFEAGALAKAIDLARVVPVLIGLGKADLQWPLAQFQAVEADMEGILSLVTALNASLGESAIPANALITTYKALWPNLKAALEEIPEGTTTTNERDRRSDRAILEEILESTRGVQRAANVASRRLHPGQEYFASEIRLQNWEDYFYRGVDLANTRAGSISDLSALRAYNDAIATTPIDLNPNDKARLYNYRAAMFKRLGRLEEALNDLNLGQKWARERHEIEDAKYNRACVLAMMGRKPEAISLIKDLISDSDKWRALIRHKAGSYFKSLEEEPEFLELTDSLATVEKLRWDTANAIESEAVRKFELFCTDLVDPSSTTPEHFFTSVTYGYGISSSHASVLESKGLIENKNESFVLTEKGIGIWNAIRDLTKKGTPHNN
jgi:tetratricopeptide (TPR) repeat protein